MAARLADPTANGVQRASEAIVAERFHRALREDPYMLYKLRAELANRGDLMSFIKVVWQVLHPAATFTPGYHLEAMAEHLEAVSRGEVKRLLINVPPGFMKSLMVRVFWPAYEWGPLNRPWKQYISASNSIDLSIRDNRRARLIIESDVYRYFWNHVRLAADQNAKVQFRTSLEGFMEVASIGGKVTGRRGDALLIDDPHNVSEAESDQVRHGVLTWFKESVQNRLNNPRKGVIVVIMQRVHMADLSADILERELGYEHLCLPMEYEPLRRCYTSVKPKRGEVEPEWVRRGEADDPVSGGIVRSAWIASSKEEDGARLLYPWDKREREGQLLWPEFFPMAEAMQLRHDMGEYAWAGQYQQTPTPRGGGLFQRHWFGVVDEAPAGGRTVRGWDLAATESLDAAYTAGVKMRLTPKGEIYILDARRLRGSPRKVEEAILNTAEQDGRSVVIDLPQDPGQAGKAQKSAYLRLLAGFQVKVSPESGSKEDRARPLSAQAEAGNVFMVRGGWNTEFLEELCNFPRGVYKDQVDAASRAYSNLVRYRKKYAFGEARIV